MNARIMIRNIGACSIFALIASANLAMAVPPMNIASVTVGTQSVSPIDCTDAVGVTYLVTAKSDSGGGGLGPVTFFVPANGTGSLPAGASAALSGTITWAAGETNTEKSITLTITTNATLGGTYSFKVKNSNPGSPNIVGDGTLVVGPSCLITPSSSSVCADSSGNTASVASTAGATYAWIVTNGTLDSGDGTSAISYTAGSTGTVGLSVTVSLNGCPTACNTSVTIAGACLPGQVCAGGACVPTGSCCAADGSCTVTAQAACSGAWTSGGVCNPNSCPQPTGSCCAADGTCSATTQANCSGSWTGGGVCEPNSCPQPTGSCCAADGTCAVTTAAECAGSWTAGGVCDPNTCPQPNPEPQPNPGPQAAPGCGAGACGAGTAGVLPFAMIMLGRFRFGRSIRRNRRS